MQFINRSGRLFGVAYLLILLFAVVACVAESEPPGKALATQYCQSCHLLPEPKDLNKNTWNFDVLPLMAARLGHPAGDVSEIELLRRMDLLPDTTTLSMEDWQEIRKYYVEGAPLAMPPGNLLEISDNLDGFQTQKVTFPSEAPFTSLLNWQAGRKQLLYGNAAQRELHNYNWQTKEKTSLRLDGSPSYIIEDDSGYYVLTMGKVMPHNDKIGTLSYIPVEENGAWGEPEVWINSLARPVHASIGDLNADGKEDIVISSFGYYKGELSWYSDFKSPQREKHVLKALPGAVKTVIDDFNQDGRPDVLALMTQGDEQFLLFLNQGDNQFRQKILLRFPPSYGSTYFEYKDFNQDGLKDLLYVNGDNGDYAPIVKNYHGIRLYLNKGNLEFEEAFFIEQHGITKAIAEDYDQDGDLDIAAISYFPDYQNRREESFVYYENTGSSNFQAATFESLPSGKWLTMDAADIDQDGDQDIILGSAMFMTKEAPPEIRKNWGRQNTNLIILENTN